jgi:hypothetical protein
MGQNILQMLSGLSGLITSAPTVAVPLLNALGVHMQGNSSTNSSITALLDQMQAHPEAAVTYEALISALPNVPAGVLTELDGAAALASDKTAYVEAMIRAKAALGAATSNSAIGSILAGLTVPTA